MTDRRPHVALLLLSVLLVGCGEPDPVADKFDYAAGKLEHADFLCPDGSKPGRYRDGADFCVLPPCPPRQSWVHPWYGEDRWPPLPPYPCVLPAPEPFTTPTVIQERGPNVE